jgi:F0F1-type ATP synthase assembly protein I
MHKKFFGFMYGLNIISQAIFSLLTPAALLFALSWLLVRYVGAPEWLYAIFITVGVLAGLVSMVRFAISASENLERLEKQKEKDRKTGSNINEK